MYNCGQAWPLCNKIICNHVPHQQRENLSWNERPHLRSQNLFFFFFFFFLESGGNPRCYLQTTVILFIVPIYNTCRYVNDKAMNILCTPCVNKNWFVTGTVRHAGDTWYLLCQVAVNPDSWTSDKTDSLDKISECVIYDTWTSRIVTDLLYDWIKENSAYMLGNRHVFGEHSIHNDKVPNLYNSPRIVKAVKSRCPSLKWLKW
jgi:hypothetical protein